MPLFAQIYSAQTMEQAVREAGIIPFFPCAIPGYSIQELTKPGFWFGDEEGTLGPWDWKIECVRSGDIAYGKFLCGGKAAFATIPWYRELMNVRRAKYGPDLSGRKILDLAARQGAVSIKEVRALLDVKKGAADAAMGKLMHQCRMVTGDISRVYGGPNLSYKGWQRASFCTPESLFESDAAFAGFPGFPGFSDAGSGLTLHTGHSPEESLDLLISHISGLFPDAARAQILKVLR